MQRLLEGRMVEDDQRKQGIMETVSDKYCRLILKTTMYKPKSAMEIASESKIPISTVYRRLQTLYDNKLVKISGSISEDGKKYFLYKSKVKAISISCDCNNLEITIVPNIEVSEYSEKNYVSSNA